MKKNVLLAALCLLASCVLLLLCSQCSPLYPTNVWVDANCLLTVGRVMKEGGVLYRDIYEQKGPTLYLINMLAACISDTSFLGVYVMEVISFAATLFLACRIAMRRAGVLAAFADAVMVGACVLVGQSFSRGNSAEEFCLPLLMAALCIAYREYGEKKGPMRPKMLFACGVMAGLVATIKFTVLGLFVGLCVAEGVLALMDGGMRRALKSAGAFLTGMMLPVAAWCVYFAAHGALYDFYTAYIYNNIFLYTDEARTLIDVARDIWMMIRGNLLWLCVSGIALGFNWVLLFEAYRYTTVATATLCYYMAPMLIILASPHLLHERLTARKVLCVIAAVIGMGRNNVYLRQEKKIYESCIRQR